MATYYVDGAAGADTNAGTTQGAGGAWATIGKAASTAVAGDVVYIKASATYTLTSTVAFATAGNPASGPITYRGYTTTPGADDGRPTITSATSSLALFNVNADYLAFRHLRLTHTGATRGSGFVAAAATRFNLSLYDCVLDGLGFGIDGEYTTYWTFTPLLMYACEVKNCTVAGVANAMTTMLGCYVHDNPGDGWRRGRYSFYGSPTCFDHCVFSGNARNIACNMDASSATQYSSVTVLNSVVRNAGNAGLAIGFYAADNTQECWLLLKNNIFIGNGTYAVTSTNLLAAAVQVNNAFYSNTSGNRNASIPAGSNDIILTGDPFTNASSGDYSLNNVAGAGAACRNAGFPGVALFGTGYDDVGPLRHQDPAGGGGGTVQTVLLG